MPFFDKGAILGERYFILWKGIRFILILRSDEFRSPGKRRGAVKPDMAYPATKFKSS